MSAKIQIISLYWRKNSAWRCYIRAHFNKDLGGIVEQYRAILEIFVFLHLDNS